MDASEEVTQLSNPVVLNLLAPNEWCRAGSQARQILYVRSAQGA